MPITTKGNSLYKITIIDILKFLKFSKEYLIVNSKTIKEDPL